jgi:hypothetical protein
VKPLHCALPVMTVGVLLLSACEKKDVALLRRPPAEGPLKVKVTCNPDVTIGLVDGAGNQAWAFQAKEKDPVEWQVDSNVTSIEIQPKDARNPLPLDSTPSGTEAASLRSPRSRLGQRRIPIRIESFLLASRVRAALPSRSRSTPT